MWLHSKSCIVTLLSTIYFTKCIGTFSGWIRKYNLLCWSWMSLCSNSEQWTVGSEYWAVSSEQWAIGVTVGPNIKYVSWCHSLTVHIRYLLHQLWWNMCTTPDISHQGQLSSVFYKVPVASLLCIRRWLTCNYGIQQIEQCIWYRHEI